MPHSDRLAGYGAVSTALALLSDRHLAELVDTAPIRHQGIGGTTALLQVAGTAVFVKRVALTELENRPEHRRSTANLFELPTCYQYGVGSAGFGVWRELAAHTMTTNWVLGGRCASFPLMYHWRVVDGPPPTAATGDDQAVERMVAHWGGSPAVRDRLAAIASAPASVVLFLEYLPYELNAWLTAQLGGDADTVGAAAAMVLGGLLGGASFMNANGLTHFDAHFGNVLTDGRRLYFADFGLATSTRFELSAAERRFVADNQDHDVCHTITCLVNRLVTGLTGTADRDDFVRRCAEGPDQPMGLAAPAAAIVSRYAPVAVVMNRFYRTLHLDSRTEPFPAADLRRARAGCGAAN